MIFRMIEKLKKILIETEGSMQETLFNVICFGGAIAALLNIIYSLACGVSMIQTGLIFIAFVVLAVILYFVEMKKLTREASIIIIASMSLVFFPVMFFTCGGLQSGMGVWFVFCITINVLMLNGMVFFVLLVMQIVFTIGCYILAYYCPYLVESVPNTQFVFFDTAQNIIVVSLLIGFVSRFQQVVYNRALNRISEQNDILKHSEEQADSANRAKSDFLSNMSHEIRTPINAILGMNEMILRESHDKKVLEYATSVQTSSKALLSLINDVLDISKIESGKTEIVNENYRLADLILESYGMVSERLEKKALRGTVYCDPKIPSEYEGDLPHIRQILVNLLSNAVKYTEKGVVDFSVRAKKLDEHNMSVEFTVKDSGIGIKPENLTKVFNKFERFDISKNRKIEGTGLGLNIAKQLANLMGGDIKVSSVYGSGTEFTLTIPQKIVNASEIGEVSPAKKRRAKEVFIYHQSFEAPDAQILAVDDVEMNLIVFENLLKETRMHIEFATSGAQCIEKASVKKYDMIFMDHMMPEMNGIETLTKLHTMDTPNNETPVIMLTANALAGVRKEYIKAGFKDYLSKPVDGQALEKLFLQYLPEEKVLIQDDGSIPCGEKIAKLRKFLPEFNYETALGYYDDSEDLCIEIITDYCVHNHKDHLSHFFEECEWENYRQILNSLKNTTRTIGLPALAERFRLQEQAVKKCDLDYAKKNHASLMDSYMVAVSKMHDAGFVREKNEEDD